MLEPWTVGRLLLRRPALAALLPVAGQLHRVRRLPRHHHAQAAARLGLDLRRIGQLLLALFQLREKYAP